MGNGLVIPPSTGIKNVERIFFLKSLKKPSTKSEAFCCDMLISGEPSNQLTLQAQTASRAYQDGGPREVRTSVRAFVGRRKKYIRVRILFYAKYLLFSIFRAFYAIFTLRVEDPFKSEKKTVRVV